MAGRVFSNRVTADGTVVATPALVKGVSMVTTTAAAASVVLRDGGASGTIRLTLDAPATAGAAHYVKIPGDGIRFETDVYADITNLTGVTVIYA